jgi:4-amino-4-deoxy-L-arabinose transferase-like glycosyltransferase
VAKRKLTVVGKTKAPARDLDRDKTAPWYATKAFAIRAVVLLGILVFFFNLGSYGLWEPDEARYAEIAREMLQLRDFVVPHLNYVPYVEKPPLLYWLTAFFFTVLGLNEFAARLVPALSALGGLVATFFFARKCFGRRHAILAGAILATAPLYAVMAQVLTTDMLLTALVTVASFALFFHYREGGRWCWLAYVAMGFATLTKGPVGIAIPVFAMFVFLAWQRELAGAIRRFHVVAGALLTVAIAAPWFVAVSMAEPGFLSFYFIGEYVRRVFQPSYSHAGPIYFYVPVLIGGLLPWSLTMPFFKWRHWEPNPARRFCVILAAVIFGAFSLASAKLIPYVLPAFPPLAVLVADGIISTGWPGAARADRPGRPALAILFAEGPILSVMGAISFAVAFAAPLFRSPYPMTVRPALYVVGAILITGGAASTAAFLWRRPTAGLAAVVLTVAVSLCAGTYGRLEAEPLRSYAALSRAVASRAPDATLVCYYRYVQSLPFYTGRRVILVGPKTELAFGAKHCANADRYFFTSDADLLRLWKAPHPTVLVIDAPRLKRLAGELGHYTVIAAEHNKRAILNHE